MAIDKVMEEAMQIILHAGDARMHCTEALKAIEQADFACAQEKIELANQEILKAHRVQTTAIQGETKGETGVYSILFVHAQDTLMTVLSEINLTKRFIKIFESYEARLKKLEE